MSNPGGWWGATIGAVLVYVSAVLVSVPPPLFFFPRLGTWSFHASPGEPAISWYGRLIYATVGGLLGMLIGRLVKRRLHWGLVWLIATVALLALTWHERHWFLR